ncbi:unnamed protein product [Acanthoscelides obtectus]|uniref:Uncharacterized protein n=1 Tax=Acanthoscelides obtectus TaxID=200917 RepID=A0A9P0L2I0_ACAOB|nr:unnamed protein product [Acanthoscelides obtectus]CAK1679629.1 hypothetical protein AOBTE_LOCUS32389 [Acanthoscelides obtectus]
MNSVWFEVQRCYALIIDKNITI